MTSIWNNSITGQYKPASTRSALYLVNAAIERGGTTITNDGDEIENETGFVVGGIVPSLVIEAGAEEAVEQTENFITSNRTARYYGSWNDAGTIHIDAVDIIKDREEALRLGAERGELAIYDLAAGEEVRIA